MGATEIALVVSAFGLALTIIGLLGRGLYVWGRMSQKVDAMDAKMDVVLAETQAMNRMMVGLANHRHDVDGNTTFTIPTV